MWNFSSQLDPLLEDMGITALPIINYKSCKEVGDAA